MLNLILVGLALAGCVLLYVLPLSVAEHFPPRFGLGVLYWLLVGGTFSTVTGILVHLVRRRNLPRSASGPLVACTLLLIVSIPAHGPLQGLGTDLFLHRRQARLEDLARRIRDDARIPRAQSYRAWMRFRTKVERDDSGVERVPHVPADAPDSLRVASRRDSTSLAAYLDYRRELAAMGFVDFESREDRIAFQYSGFLDNCTGFLWIHSDKRPSYGEDAPHGKIVGLRRCAPRWYHYVTT